MRTITILAAALTLAACADVHQVIRGNCSVQQALMAQCVAVREAWVAR